MYKIPVQAIIGIIVTLIVTCYLLSPATKYFPEDSVLLDSEFKEVKYFPRGESVPIHIAEKYKKYLLLSCKKEEFRIWAKNAIYRKTSSNVDDPAIYDVVFHAKALLTIRAGKESAIKRFQLEARDKKSIEDLAEQALKKAITENTLIKKARLEGGFGSTFNRAVEVSLAGQVKSMLGKDCSNFDFKIVDLSEDEIH